MKIGCDGVVCRGYHELLLCISSRIRNLDESHGFETAVGGYWVNIFRTCISEACLKFSMSNSRVKRGEMEHNSRLQFCCRTVSKL